MTKLKELETAEALSDYQANQLLFSWLSDDDERVDLYAQMRESRKIIRFSSRALLETRKSAAYQQDVYLLSQRDDILTAMAHFSNSPYNALGTGTFMLGMDRKDKEHIRQRKYMAQKMRYTGAEIQAAAAKAWAMASVLPLKGNAFDLVKDIAEQAALRFTGILFGFKHADQILLQKTMAKAYQGMSYQMFARHFVTDPAALPKAERGMGILMARIAEIIDEGSPYAEPEFPDPILRRMVNTPDNFTGSELAVLAVGSIAGIIGNIEASVSLSVAGLFQPQTDRKGKQVDALGLARRAIQDGDDEGLSKIIFEALRLNPPAPFLPRAADGKHLEVETGKAKKPIPKDAVVILPIGSACRDIEDGDAFDPDRDNSQTMVFGEPEHGKHSHRCIGDKLIMPVVTRFVREILSIPSLAKQEEDQHVEKLWGFNCERFPMACQAAQVQQPLNVVMRVRSPVAEHAAALKAIITVGAPRIEKSLKSSGLVHFARFIFLDDDSKLALLTTFDDDFDAYVGWFADKVGDLFDELFAHIEDPPTMPVKDNPEDFIEKIRQYNIAPAGGYFFSADPKRRVKDGAAKKK